MKSQLVALVSLVIMICGQPALPAPIKGWVMKQVSDYRGAHTVYFTPTVAKVQTQDFCVLARDKSNIIMYNDANKTYIEMTPKDFNDRVGDEGYYSGMKMKKGKPSTILGIKVDEYILEKFNKIGEVNDSVEVWHTSYFHVPQRLADQLATVFGLPPGYGVPLRIVRKWGGRKAPIKMLDTASVKPATFSAADFKLGPDFRKVRSESELIAGDALMGMDDFASPPQNPAAGRTRAAAPAVPGAGRTPASAQARPLARTTRVNEPRQKR